MPNKNVPNGFYMFMLEEQSKLKSQTGRAPGMHEMPAMCKDTWKSLSATVKAHYDTLAKQEKMKRKGGPTSNHHRKDNQRQIIAHRSDPTVQKEKRRVHETHKMMESWGDRDLLDIVFYVIDFQVMYDERLEDHHLPMEVGLVSFTLRGGLQKFYHSFINPGDAPQGNRHIGQKFSENTHKIPINFEQGEVNYNKVWTSIENFLGEVDDTDDIPPLYCLSDHSEIVESCLHWLHCNADSMMPNRLKVYCMEDLVTALIMRSGKTQRRPALSQIHDALRQNMWDYTSSIRCSYHEQEDCSYCSISIVRRYSFAAFDLLSELLNFTLTKSHVPEEPQQQFTVLDPKLFGNTRGFRRQQPSAWSHREEENRSGYSNTSRPGNSHNSYQQHSGRSATNFPPKIDRFEINLSDDDEDDDDVRTIYEDEEDNALTRPEVKSTSDQYQLRELRKPNTPSVLQAAYGAGDRLTMLGRGRAAVRPSHNAGDGVTPIPPPGFGPRPIRPVQTSAPGLGTIQPLAGGLGRGRGRGRGLPPQV